MKKKNWKIGHMLKIQNSTVFLYISNKDPQTKMGKKRLFCLQYFQNISESWE